MTAVRERQHELIDSLLGEMPELLSALAVVNFAVQQVDEDGAETRAAGVKVDEVVRRMTTPEVTDAELRRRLESLKAAALTGASGPMELGLAERLRGYAALQDRLDDGCQKAGRGAQQLDVLVQLPGQRGIEQEPVRGLNERVIPCAESVAERLRELQRGGLGEIPGVRLIFWRPRARLFGNLIARSGY